MTSPIRPLLLALTAVMYFGGAMAQQTLAGKVAAKYRHSLVYFKVERTAGDTGEVFESQGAGFIVSDRGHVMTNCHVVDDVLRDKAGKALGRPVSKVTVTGATGSRAAPLEQVGFLACAQYGIDLALLKFKNSAVKRVAVKVTPSQPAIGDEVAMMGFPLNAEFFTRNGVLSGEEELDRLLVDMNMNPGDSGGPVFDGNLNVVAVAEAGFGAGTGTGVVRPIRHGAHLLSMAGVNFFAVNASLNAVAAADKPVNSKIFYGLGTSPDSVFTKPVSIPIAENQKELKITYPVFQVMNASTEPGVSGIDVKTIAARPGFKILDARFVITDKSAADVLHIGPSSDGSAVRAAFERGPVGRDAPFVRGYIETLQVPIK